MLLLILSVYPFNTLHPRWWRQNDLQRPPASLAVGTRNIGGEIIDKICIMLCNGDNGYDPLICLN